jgi:SAM-dependent methyltransferase
MSDHLRFEREFWGDCTNTFAEDQKHYVYARFMGLRDEWWRFVDARPAWPAEGLRVLDIGGGPSSMLLKVAHDITGSMVIDPIEYPAWTQARYAQRGVRVFVGNAEDVIFAGFHEAWIYNCLQHTHDPQRIIRNALMAAPVLRLFEWIDIPPHEGHPQMLTEALLNEWTGGVGTVQELAESGCYGRGYGVVIDQRVPALAA